MAEIHQSPNRPVAALTIEKAIDRHPEAEYPLPVPDATEYSWPTEV